jgi:hypothetical protein
MLLLVMKLPPLCGFDAVAALPEQDAAVVAFVALVAFVAFVALVAKLTDCEPMLLLVIKVPPLAGFEAVAALPEQEAAVVALVAVAAFPLMLIDHVPEAPVPVLDGASLAISALTKAVVAT